MKITPQHEQYGLPHRAARPLPDVKGMESFFGGRKITPGLMKRAEAEEEELAEEI